MGAEDFSYYLQQRPGCFFFVGAALNGWFSISVYIYVLCICYALLYVLHCMYGILYYTCVYYGVYFIILNTILLYNIYTMHITIRILYVYYTVSNVCKRTINRISYYVLYMYIYL